MEIQIAANNYWTKDYVNKHRWLSYWTQIESVLELEKAKVLEIGVGNRLVSDFLTKLGHQVITLDFDRDLRPSLVADITAVLPLKSGSFEIVLCAEVLEHIPFEKVSSVISEFRRVSTDYVVISLPSVYFRMFYFSFRLPKLHPRFWQVTIPHWNPPEHQWNGEHYWEIGKKGYPVQRIRKTFNEAGFEILRETKPEPDAYHHFFVLRRK